MDALFALHISQDEGFILIHSEYEAKVNYFFHLEIYEFCL